MKTNFKFLTDLDHFRDQLKEIQASRFLIIWDENVYQLYKKPLKLLGPKFLNYVAPSGESCKSFDEYKKCVEFFLNENVAKDCHFIAIGGGALSDMAGFAAATIHRGLPWSIIPTTLLSLIDASIGGKTAINSNCGKNMIGNFHMPSNVFQSEIFLDTLEVVEMNSAHGEVLKYAFLDEFISVLINSDYTIKELIQTCTAYKTRIVEEDEKDKGARKVLNFGHTFGHAFEKKYNLQHGVAVGLGIKLIIEKFCQKKDLERFNGYIEKLSLVLPNDLELSKEDIKEYVFKDKKMNSTESIDLILLSEEGKPNIVPTSCDDILSKF